MKFNALRKATLKARKARRKIKQMKEVGNNANTRKRKENYMSTASNLNPVKPNLIQAIEDLSTEFINLETITDAPQRWAKYTDVCVRAAELVNSLSPMERTEEVQESIDGMYAQQKRVKGYCHIGKAESLKVTKTFEPITDKAVLTQIKSFRKRIEVMGRNYQLQISVQNDLYKNLGVIFSNGKKSRRVDIRHPEFTKLWQEYWAKIVSIKAEEIAELNEKESMTEEEAKRLEILIATHNKELNKVLNSEMNNGILHDVNFTREEIGA